MIEVPEVVCGSNNAFSQSTGAVLEQGCDSVPSKTYQWIADVLWRLDSLTIRTVRKTMEVPQSQFLDRVVDVLW